MRSIDDLPRAERIDVKSGVRTAAVSVIIPTKNRPHDLRKTVETLLRQTILPSELIVVDQSPDTETANLLQHLFDGRPGGVIVALRYVRDPGISGGATARNVAMSLARGDLWLFLDDDVEMDPQFIEELMEAYATHPEASGVSGIITNYPKPGLAYRLWMTVFMLPPFFDDRQPVYWDWRRRSSGKPQRVTRLGAGLMSFRADRIRNVKFDERLRGVSDGEDVDFCCRLAGEMLLIAPRAKLRHCQSSSGRLVDHWLRRSARGLEFLYQKNWRTRAVAKAAHLWLLVGFGAVATWASVRAQSFAPWKALRAGLREGRSVVHSR